jgi:hypothetical protein
MNKVYLISYDLKTPFRNYNGLYEEIKKATRWWHFLESTWLIYTAEAPDEIWRRFASHVGKDDRLLIIEVRDKCQGWLPKEAWRPLRICVK